MPLDARASIGRWAAGVLTFMAGMAALIGGGAAPGDDVPTEFIGTIVISTALGMAVLLGLGQWRDRLRPSTQEAALLVLSLVPTAGAIAAYLLDAPDDPDAIIMLLPIAIVAALTLRPTTYWVGVTATIVVATTLATTRDGLREVMFALLGLTTGAAMAGLAAHVMARTYAEKEAHQSEVATANRALRVVVDAARTATSGDPQAVLDAIVAATAGIPSEVAGIHLLHEDGLLRYGASHQVPEHLRHREFPPTQGLVGRALSEDRAVVSDDYGTDERGMEEYRALGLSSAVATPIRVAGEPVGVLVVGRKRMGGYRPSEVAAVQLLADHAGQALALSRAIDEDRRLLDRLQSLHALQEDFVATVSHELRTPLTVIDGLAATIELRHERLDTGQLVDLVGRLRANTTSLTTIVTSLLDAARLDRGLVEVEDGHVDVRELIEGCTARLAPIMADHRIDIDVDDAVVVGDAALLQRVVDNLLTNAQRHTPAGTTVRITTEVTAADVAFVVSDDGPGIDQEDLHRITERFTRGGELHTRQSRGLGLGLALADQILRLHGTRLLVTSPPGEGAQFQFRLRTADVPELTRPG